MINGLWQVGIDIYNKNDGKFENITQRTINENIALDFNLLSQDN